MSSVKKIIKTAMNDTSIAAKPKDKKENTSPPPEKMDKFAQIITLLHAVVTVRNQNDNLSMHAFTAKGPTDIGLGDSDFAIDFATLDAFSAVLTQGCGVVAASFRRN